MNINKLELKKHSALIQMSNKITLQQRKAFNSLLYIARNILKEKSTEHIFTVNIETIKRMSGIEATNNIQIKDSLENLNKIHIKYNILDKDKKETWGVFSLVAGVEINKDGLIEFSFPHQIYRTLLRPDIYAILDLNIIKGLTSKHAIALYELARDYANAEIPEISIEDLRDLFGIDNSQYKNNYDLKREVIDVAIKEINTKTDLYITYALIKSGRKIVSAKFTIIKKQPDIKLLPVANSKIKNNPSETLSEEQKNILTKLLKTGILKAAAIDIIKSYPLENIKDQIEWLESRKPKDPAAMLIQAIKEEWTIPGELMEAKQKEDSQKMLEDVLNKAKKAKYIILPNLKRCKISSIQNNGYIEIIGDDNKKYMVQPTTVCSSSFE